MVQRKVPAKLGIKPDHVKPGNLKPASQDNRPRTSDLAKKMKKSGSTKLSDIKSPRSSVLKRNVFLPGKPPPEDAPTITATPKKQKPVSKTIEGSPNYMKSTSSSSARTGSLQSPVSSRVRTRADSDSKISCRRDLSSWKNSPASVNKGTKSLAKSSSSLKLVRTLTKVPSFKNSRATLKKCSRVALCADVNSQRATCASTLKDSQFPPYLDLDPGGTESEGTSVFKVCPYTYCSLNGHRHASLPPLKRFLSARRRMMKTQRNMRLEALSPRRRKQAVEETEKVDEELGSLEPDLNKSGESAEMGLDYFIEIYANGKTDDSMVTEESKEEEGKGSESSQIEQESSVLMPSYGGCDDDKQVTESLSDGSPRSELDFAESFTEEDNHFHFEYQGDDMSSEESEMDWEDGKLFASENECLIKLDDESDSKDGDLLETKNHGLQDEPEKKKKEIITILQEEVLAKEEPEEISVDEYALQVLFDYDQVSIEGMAVGEDIEEKLSTYEDNGSQRIEEPNSECNYEGEEQPAEAEELDSFHIPDQSEGSLAADDDEIELIEPGQTAVSDDSNLMQDGPEEQSDLGMENSSSAGESMEEQNGMTMDSSETSHGNGTDRNPGKKSYQSGTRSKDEDSDDFKLKWTFKNKRTFEDLDESRKFNPREPNYLPEVPEPEGEKVDLRHQEMDEKKNSEDWMLDHALQKAVNKLGPARKRKVALLVEAFETVIPASKCEIRVKHTPSSFLQARPTQACR